MGLCWLLTSPSTPEMVRVSPRAFFIGKAMHYYQFNIGDYASHTRHLTIVEDAIYRRLLDAYYLHEHPLNACATSVARQINAREYESEIQTILEEFFALTEDGWVNFRADKEIKHFHSKIEQAQKAGRASAVARLNRRSTPVPTDVQPNIKQETINNKHSISKPDDVILSVWTDFVAHRKLKKATITETVINSIRKEAKKAGIPFEDALAETCARGWQGFKAEWYKKQEPEKPVSKLKYWEKGYQS